VLIADLGNYRVRRIDPATGVITTVAGDGVQGSSPDGTVATAAHLVAPSRLTIAPDGSAVFADTCDLQKVLIPILGQHWDQIQSVCDGRVRRIDTSSGVGVLRTVAGSQGKDCEPDITATINGLVNAYHFTPDPSVLVSDPSYPVCGDGAAATAASLRGPAALRYDAAGNLYIGEIGGSYVDYMTVLFGVLDPSVLQTGIRRVDAATGIITTIVNTDHLGAGFSGDGGPASQSKFLFPAAFAPDGGTHLFVADLMNNRIRKIEGAKPDLHVSLAGGPFTAGQTGVLHVTVTNAATDPDAYLTGPVSTDVTLPAGLSYASASVVSPFGVHKAQDGVASWSCDGSGQAVSCSTNDNLAPRAASTFDITVTVDPNAPDTVTVNANGSSDSDVSNPANQVAVLGISVRRSAPPAPSDGRTEPITEPERGYVLAGADGGTFAFGAASFPGAAEVGGSRVVAGAPAGAHGSWLTTADGSVFTTGDAQFEGSLGATKLNSPIVGIAAHGADGYWLVGADGGVFAEGSARFHGSLGAMTLNSPVVGMTSTPSGNGYWLVAKDGGVFAEGDAQFFGSSGATRLNSSIVAMRATSTGMGYWLVAADGGVFAYGDAIYAGSHAAIPLNSPIAAVVPTQWGTGYWLVARDGGVFAYGTAAFDGSMAGSKLKGPIVAAW
jgi:hypothetical protein